MKNERKKILSTIWIWNMNYHPLNISLICCHFDFIKHSELCQTPFDSIFLLLIFFLYFLNEKRNEEKNYLQIERYLF